MMLNGKQCNPNNFLMTPLAKRERENEKEKKKKKRSKRKRSKEKDKEKERIYPPIFPPGGVEVNLDQSFAYTRVK